MKETTIVYGSIAFVLTLFLLVQFVLPNSSNKVFIDYNGVQLRESDYGFIKNNLQDYPAVRVCNIDSGNCILLNKIPGGKE